MILSRQIKASDKYKTKHPRDGSDDGTSNTESSKFSLQSIEVPTINFFFQLQTENQNSNIQLSNEIFRFQAGNVTGVCLISGK